MATSPGAAGGMLPPDLSAHWYNADDFAPGEPWKAFDPARTALVLVDLINWQVDPSGPSIAAMRAQRRCQVLCGPGTGGLGKFRSAR